MKKKIVIIDDEKNICDSLIFALKKDYDVYSFTEPESGIARLKDFDIDVCLLDLRLGLFSGMDILKDIKASNIPVQVIMMTAYGDEQTSVEALSNGAFEYVNKPIDVTELRIIIERAVELSCLKSDVEFLSKELNKLDKTNPIVAESAIMKDIKNKLAGISNSDSNVLLRGEPGTGKRLISKRIVMKSARKNGRYGIIACMAFSDVNHIDISDYANGTVYLDEICALKLEAQEKLLYDCEQYNIRLIVGTSMDIDSLRDQGEFSKALYYNINVVSLRIPPLRERREDIIPLCNLYIKKFCNEQKKNIKGISNTARNILMQYDYPGNARQLVNIIEHAVIMTSGDILSSFSLPEDVEKKNKGMSTEKTLKEIIRGKTLEEIEEIAIMCALEQNGGKKKEAAAQLGISERTLWNKLKAYKQ